MKSKMMIISSSYYVHGALCVEALLEYYDVYFTGNLSNPSYEYNFDQDLLNRHVKLDIFAKNIKEYKIIFGVDNRTAGYLNYLKKNVPTIKTAIQILDYPKHVFKTNKNYNYNAHKMWDDYIKNNCFSNMDFIIYNKKYAFDELSLMFNKPKSTFIRYPISCDVSFLSVPEENFIVYSGRISPDKGIHYIIDALGTLEEDIELITIGRGFDYSEYAKHLNVKYKNIKNCSEKDKWGYYNKCKFVVCGADNPCLAASCVLEGLLIGKTSVVFDYPESKIQYGDLVFYTPPLNIEVFARTIRFLLNNKNERDIAKIKGPLYVKNEISYDIWAKRVFKFFSED